MNLTLARPRKWRTLLVLGRVSNLPTVWSNCLAGWWLSNGLRISDLLLVMLWVSFLYLGGMFLNDAFDSGFDRNHRPTRPIPSGAIAEGEVWLWGLGWILLGLAGLAFMGKTTFLLGVALVVCILIYDAIHKITVLSPLVMGTCRVFVYLVAASAGFYGVRGDAVWKGLALGSYVVGLSYLARKESAPVRIQYWPAIFLTAPLIVAWILDDGADRKAAMISSVILLLWVLWTLGQTYGREHPNVGRAVARLLAGIALVDLLAVADLSHFAAIFFLIFFWVALLLQRFVPAT